MTVSKIHTSSLVTLLLLGGTVACVPPPAVPLNPHFEPSMLVTRWERGQARVTLEEDHLAVTATFLEGGPDTLLFDLEVRNRTDIPLLVTPEKVECQIWDAQRSMPRWTVRALDPEKEIRRLAEASHALDRQREVDRARNGTFALLGLAAEVIATVDDARAPRQEKQVVAATGRAAWQSAALAEDVQAADHQVRLGDLAQQRTPWEQDCLRRTTLEPGQGVRGRLVFRLDATEAQALKLNIPLRDRTFSFTYAPKRSEGGPKAP